MPKCLKSTTTPCVYADDTEIFASSHDYDSLVKNLNNDLKNLHTWGRLYESRLAKTAEKSKISIKSIHS